MALCSKTGYIKQPTQWISGIKQCDIFISEALLQQLTFEYPMVASSGQVKHTVVPKLKVAQSVLFVHMMYTVFTLK